MLENAEPLVAATLYYISIFAIAELGRRASDQAFSKGSSARLFLYEALGTATVCSCVFEHGVIIEHYGIWGFFIVSSIVGFFFGYLGKGAYGNPLAPLEQLYYSEITVRKFVVLVMAQITGGYFSWRLAQFLWWHSLSLSEVHTNNVMANYHACHVHHHHHFLAMMLFEMSGCFLMRIIFVRLPEKLADYLIPIFMGIIFSFSISYMGDSALDPVVGATLFFGCKGVSQQSFAILYWGCPIIGWLLAAHLDRKAMDKKQIQRKKSERTEKKQGKEENVIKQSAEKNKSKKTKNE